MVKSKTKISHQEKRKTDRGLVETIRASKKLKGWQVVATILSRPKSAMKEVNLSELRGEGTLIVPGKVLSMGTIEGKIKVAALRFSERAREKLIMQGARH